MDKYVVGFVVREPELGWLRRGHEWTRELARAWMFLTEADAEREARLWEIDDYQVRVDEIRIYTERGAL